MTQETLQLQAFQFTSDNSSAMLVHCDVIVCNVSDPANRCRQGCLTGSKEPADDDVEEVGVGVLLQAEVGMDGGATGTGSGKFSRFLFSVYMWMCVFFFKLLFID
jgi:hypothetical protein